MLSSQSSDKTDTSLHEKTCELGGDIEDSAHLSFGVNQLHAFQRDAIKALLSGRDALVVQPTASGKSLCYQLPSIMLRGTVLVISPLISLMEQQYLQLKGRGIEARFLTAEMDPKEAKLTEQAVQQGVLDILFVAPERLQSSYFQSLICASPIELIAVDEAHCLTTWGHDFRPDYVEINRFLTRFVSERGQRPPVIALTATADRVTRQEVIRLLDLKDPYVSSSIPKRDNLKISVGYRKQGYKQVLSIVQNRFAGVRGIIYCPTRELVEKLTANLNQNQVAALPYHAGLSRQIRSTNQALFEVGKARVMVATLAFGMGIDAPDLGFVLRLGLPATLESFLQEAGRAGRDGRDAEVLLMYNERDAAWAWSHASGGEQPSKRLSALFEILRGASCINDVLAEHFGFEKDQNVNGAGGRSVPDCQCPSCLGLTSDLPDLCGVLSELKQYVYGYVTAGQLTDVAQGAYGGKIEQFRLDKLAVFGSLARFSRLELKIGVRDLIADRQLQFNLETNAVDFGV